MILAIPIWLLGALLLYPLLQIESASRSKSRAISAGIAIGWPMLAAIVLPFLVLDLGEWLWRKARRSLAVRR